LKAWLVQLSPSEHMLVALLHHIAFDGLSSGILVEELAELYRSRVANREPVLKELPVQYADYAIWQRNYLSGEKLSTKIAYWKQQLLGVEPLALPVDRVRTAVHDVSGASCSRTLDKGMLETLQQLSRQEGTTLFMTLLAAFKVLMYKYCGQHDITVGSPIAGRRQHEVQGLIGFFINTLVLRSQVQPLLTFRELLQQVKQTALAAYEHQDVPFEKIVEALGIERDARRNPLYDVLFTLKESREEAKLDIGGLEFTRETTGSLPAQFDINFNVIASGEGLQLHVVYAAALYNHETIERMLSHYEQLLRAVVVNRQSAIADLEILSAEEFARLFYGFNQTKVDYPITNVVSLFKEQVLSNPNAVALLCGEEKLSYRQLDKRSEILANALRRRGVKAEVLVPVCMNRCCDMIISILAVLKAGGAYVPVDPSYPTARIEFILQDTGAKFVLTNTSSAQSLPGDAVKLFVDKDWGLVDYTETLINPAQLAYVIYTSGSTGNPKGVMIEHRSLLNYVLNAVERYATGRAASFFHLPFTFDASITSIFLPLVSGGAVVLAGKTGTEVFSDNLFNALLPYDFIKLTPSHIPLLEEKMKAGIDPAKTLVVGGEALQPAHVRFLAESGADVTVVNEYGPTEATVGCCVYSFNTGADECRTGENGVLIGRPLDNVQLYVLDEHNRPVPVGVVGELCIGGVQLARGYWNLPALTNEKFIASPFAAGERIYKTGDLARWLSDGNLEYRGRKDDQVKIRGYRIELGEVELALGKAPGVLQPAVIVNEDSQGNKRLVGYVVADASYNQGQALQFLQSALPAYMVPSLLVAVKDIPLTANGKVDRKQLQELLVEVKGDGEHAGPRTATEKELAFIWQELLEVESPGIHDDFFSLGGHSLLAIRVIAAIRNQFGKELGIKEIFDHPTISQLAVLIDGENALQSLPAISRVRNSGDTGLSYAQERLWFIDKLHGSVQYHMPWVFKLEGELDAPALEASFREIIGRHEVLRTIISEQNGIGYQVVLPAQNWQMQKIELNHQPADELIKELIGTPFDLSADFMLKVWLIKVSAGEHLLVNLVHHIAFDGWSIGIMVKELEELYSSKTSNRQPALKELPVQYRDYAAWQRQYLSDEVLQSKLDYWKHKLSGVEPLELPADFVRPAIQSMKGAVVKSTIDKALANQLLTLSQAEGATLFMTLCSAFNILLYKYTGQHDICIGTPIAGRQQQEVEGLIGFFVNTLALRNQVNGEQSFRELLRQVKQTTLEAYQQQDVPFEKIVEVLGVQRDMSRTPVFQVMFALQNMPAADELRLGQVQLSVVPPGITNAKFDLGLSINESAEGLELDIIYCADLFAETTVRAMLHHYTQLLRTLAKDPGVHVSSLSMLSTAEQRQLLREFCNLRERPAADFSLRVRFDEQLKLGGNEIVIQYKDRSLTYHELDSCVEKINWFLRKKRGLEKGSRVAVLLNRSEKLVITMLALLRSGLVYVPVDTSYPQDRISYMLDDAQPSLVLTDAGVQTDLGKWHSVTIDEVLSAEHAGGFWEQHIDAADEAYIMYTSGSTGRPKGVVLTHGNLDYLFEHLDKQYTHRGMALAFTASNAFDVSIVQVCLPVLSGGTVLVTDREQLQDLEQLVSILRRATIIDTVPGLFRLIVNYIQEHELQSCFTHTRQIFVGGDLVPDDLMQELATIFPNATISVMYGPTEAAVFSTELPYKPGTIDASCKGTVVGRPFGRSQVYVLGKAMELLPAGVEGEICIGGPGVAKGYLNQLEQSQRKFVADPFQPGQLLYRTGDVGKWTPGGLIDFKGRNDNQVKIRGNRIEPGELENKLKELNGIGEAVVVAVKRADAEIYLAAFYTGAEKTREELELHLGKSFSTSVLPSYYIHLDAVPLTSNAKVDRKQLQQIAGELAQQSKEYVAPRNAVEQELASIWQELIGVERVSIHDNFFELGGHSLLAIRIIAAIRKRLQLEVNIKSLFSHPTIARLAALLPEQTTNALPAIARRNGAQPAALSFAQERLWFIDKLQGSIQYHLPLVFRLNGKLDAHALQLACRQLLRRHEVLRTIIANEDGTGCQVVTDAGGWELQQIDIEAIQGGLQQYVEDLLSLPFDLEKDAMLKVWLIRIAEQEHVLVLVLHHIAADAWSVGILANELTELYCSAIEGREAALRELPVQYADYAVWQRSYLSGDVLNRKLGYWKEKLKAVQPLDLPTEHARPAMQSIEGAVVNGLLDKELVQSLEALSRKEGATLFMTLLTAFKVLLYKYSGQQDICVGSPAAGRQHQETEGLIGFFVNTLALRDRVEGEHSFRQLLQQVRQTTLEAYEQQEVPFEKIVEVLGVQRDMSRTPIFQVMFALQNAPAAGQLDWGGLVAETEKTSRVTAQFDLNVSIAPQDGEYHVALVYCKALFSEARMQQMLKHYCTVLRLLMEDADAKIKSVGLLDETEMRQVLYAFNDTAVAYPHDKTVVDLFEEQALKTPGAVALVFDGQQLTYRQLSERSSQLAHLLKSRGVKSGVLVPVCTDRSLDMMVAIFGIWKAGAAYVPVDPLHPASRIKYMLDDCRARLAVCHQAYAELFANTELVVLDAAELAAQPTTTMAEAASNDLSYVIYTSGSTGQPKGVMIAHRSLLNFLLSMQAQLQISEKDSTVAITTYSFDISCLELYLSLISGGTVHIANHWQVKDGYALKALVEKARPTYMQATPSGWQLLLESGWQNKQNLRILTGGEAIADALKEMLTGIASDVFNMYGPTETTIWSAMHRLQKGYKVSIGRPIANTEIYILDSSGQPCPIGVYGELCIGGDGLSKGYLNKDQLTREKFIGNPFIQGKRIYKTGDVARWLADGTLEFLGRKDEQVKVRGYRVETGEIETVLNRAPGVAQGVVVAVKDSSGNNQLAACIVTTEAFDKPAVINYLRSYLPEYMIPSLFAAVATLPLTPNGKVDRKKLREQEQDLAGAGYEAPRNQTEEALAMVWRQLLSINNPGIHDNFFETGGHSLLAMRMVAMIRKQFNKEIAIREVFLHPTIAQLAVQLAAHSEQDIVPAVQRHEKAGRIPLSFSQERLWFIDQLQGSLQYHMPYVFRLKGELDVEALEASFRQIIHRHEVLRTVIGEEDGKGYQHLLPARQWTMARLKGSDIIAQYNSIELYIENLVLAPFDLSNDFMLKVSLIELSTNEYILFTNVHHIAFDAWSIRIVVNELVQLYRLHVAREPLALPALPVQYADYAIWQRNYLSGPVLEQKLSYWKEQLQGITPLDLPTDHPRPPVQSMRGAQVNRLLDKKLVAQLRQLSQQEGVTLFMTMLAAFNVLLHKYSGQAQICVGSPVAGRSQQELEDLIGFFINTLALRTQVDGQCSFAKLLQQTKQVTLDAYEHQDVPFEKIVEALGVERDMSRTPVFQVMFMLQNLPDAGTLEFGNVTLQPENTGLASAKFDLTLSITETTAGAQLNLTYCTDLYTQHTMERMLQHYEQLLHAVLSNRAASVAGLQIIDSAEKQQLLHGFNNTAVAYPDTTVLSLFQLEVQSNPAALALVHGEESITYAELDKRSGSLANYLQTRGVKPETLVPVVMDRSIEMIVSLLAVLKAGGAYVPVDPSYPQHRIRFIVEDTGAKLALTTKENAALLPANVEHIAIDAEWHKIRGLQPGTTYVHAVQLAYVIYTSGSTGKPKGVMIEHRSLANYLLNSRSRYMADGAGTFFHLPFTFDASVTSIFVPLISGKTIDIGSSTGPEVFSDPLFNRRGAYDFIKLTPAHLKLLEAMEPGERNLTKNFIVGGEALQPAHFKFLADNRTGVTIINEYGPTEATVGCCVYAFNAASQQYRTGENGVLIGKPLDNVKLYVFDEYNNLAPIGIYGELCIGGMQVARGYLNQPGLTKEKFIENPFVKGERIYKTGDIVRWLPDGNLEYFGRKDEQVKIKGFRIEPGEIEVALSEAPGVANAVVCVNNDNGIKRLVAYVVAPEQFSKENITGYLRNRLPEYMVPTLVVQVPSIPLTANGKVDKRKLQELTAEADGVKEHFAARTEAEHALVSVWQELLGIDTVSIHDNFFELGGDSIITIQVVSRMKRKGYELKPKDLFQHQTIARLSTVITEKNSGAIVNGEQGLLQGLSGLLPIQQWFFENAPEEISHYNQSILVSINKAVQPLELSLSVEQLMRQHDALRFQYQRTANDWQQQYTHKIVTLVTEDLGQCSEERFARAVENIGDRYQRSLQVEKGELARFVLIQTPGWETHNRLLVIVHHLAIDGVSWRILLEDLALLLDQQEAGTPLSLGQKGTSYRQWYDALAAYGNSKGLPAQKQYWNKIAEQFVPLPTDKLHHSAITQKEFAHCIVTLSSALTQQLLQQVPKVYHTEVNDVLLAALARTLAQWSAQTNIIVGLEGHGREDIVPGIDLSRTVGWFTTMYPVLLALDGLNTSDELLKGIKEQLRRIPEKGIGYGVLRYINHEALLQGATPWEIIFNYLGQTGNSMAGKWFAPATEPAGNSISDTWKQTNKMEVISLVENGELRVRWNYSMQHYHRSTIETLAGNFIANLEMLIDHCLKTAESGPVFTPSDYGLSSEISFKELDAFLENKDQDLDEVMSF
jgi:amino acid adenylation domain-containing protein/non-ribosomal peptide synthase protein (TIGR01720 family)